MSAHVKFAAVTAAVRTLKFGLPAAVCATVAPSAGNTEHIQYQVVKKAHSSPNVFSYAHSVSSTKLFNDLSNWQSSALCARSRRLLAIRIELADLTLPGCRAVFWVSKEIAGDDKI